MIRLFSRTISSSVSRSTGSWLTLLLLFAVLVPSICLLWFMNQAAQNERLAVRQKLVEAYRAHLVLAQERLQTYWRQSEDRLEVQVDKISPPALFADEIRLNKADAVVCFDVSGHVVYPDDVASPTTGKGDESWTEAGNLEAIDPAAAAIAYGRLVENAANANLAARALQAQARCLIQSENRAAAVLLLTHSLADERYRQAVDFQGRLIQPNAELLAYELLKTSAPESAHLISRRLQDRLLDYKGATMRSPQRRFLMRELQRLAPGTLAFPLLSAEDLALEWITAASVNSRETGLHASSIAGIWQFASRGGRAITLHRTDNLLMRLQAVIAQPDMAADVLVEICPPGKEFESSLLSLPVGSSMPGWRLALRLQDQRLFDATTNQRISSYGWIGGVVVFTGIVLAVLTWGLVRRQMSLTQLRDDLVANVTHELKTPLASMRLLVDTLLHAPQLHEPTTRDYLQLIAQENLRLSGLIDNFLTFSRIKQNKYVFSFKETLATVVAKRAVAAVSDRFQSPGCRFTMSIQPDLPPITADADAIVTALVNLLDNAWKYSGEKKQIGFAAELQKDRVLFVVSDNGIGLSLHDTKRIFQRFYQVNQHLSPTGGGCGLGLSIVQFIVSAHRGTAHVHSEPGRGSTFTLTLPVAGGSKPSKAKV